MCSSAEISVVDTFGSPKRLNRSSVTSRMRSAVRLGFLASMDLVLVWCAQSSTLTRQCTDWNPRVVEALLDKFLQSPPYVRDFIPTSREDLRQRRARAGRCLLRRPARRILRLAGPQRG